MNKKVTLNISERLQNEIFRLCRVINLDEWSGTLFYKIIEGEFGEDTCVLHAEHVYLQDIGTSTYTEYDYTPDYFKYLMDNPELMDMKVAHIHSHNNMSVFFSATDNGELIDNAPKHNYYLSLIVNNKNDMTARVAFKVDLKEGNILEWKDSNGNIKTAPVSEEQKNVTGGIYFYEVDIILPKSVRFADERMAAINKAKPKRSYSRFSSDGYSRGGDDVFTTSRRYSGGNNWSKSQRNMEFDQGVLFDDEEFVARPAVTSKKTVLSRPIARKTDTKAVNFMIALLTGNAESSASLGETLDLLDEQLGSEHAIIKFAEMVVDNILTMYCLCYPEDEDGDNTVSIVSKSVECLKDYQDVYAHLVNPISKEIINGIQGWI